MGWEREQLEHVKLHCSLAEMAVCNCCVVGCTNHVGKKNGLSFFHFPLSDKDRCKKWEAAVRRHNWTPKSHTRICSDHFITGMIYLQDSQINNDYVCYCYSGKPNSHQIHTYFVPSKFPEVYRVVQKQHRQATDANLSRLHRCMERAARQGRLEDENVMNKSINKKEQEKLLIIGKK